MPLFWVAPRKRPPAPPAPFWLPPRKGAGEELDFQAETGSPPILLEEGLGVGVGREVRPFGEGHAFSVWR